MGGTSVTDDGGFMSPIRRWRTTCRWTIPIRRRGREPDPAMIRGRGLAATVGCSGLIVTSGVRCSDGVRLHQLVELATLYCAPPGRSRLRDFVDLVQVKRVQRSTARAGGDVMTVHQSKGGWEFDAVFLPKIHKS